MVHVNGTCGKNDLATRGLHPCLPSAGSTCKYVVSGKCGVSCILQCALPHHYLQWNELEWKMYASFEM